MAINGTAYPARQKLAQAKVLVVGVGALGSAVASRLVEAGIGTLGLVDGDRVDITNLHRQLLFRAEHVGRWKVEIAESVLRQVDSEVTIQLWRERLVPENVEELIGPFDIVACCVDNFPARYLLNDVCFFAGTPVVDGGAIQWQGQLTVWAPGSGCLRCILPEAPDQATSPTCSRVGVLGPLCGVIGNLQAAEIIKLITGEGSPLIGRVLAVDMRNMEFHMVEAVRNPRCALCGDDPEIQDIAAACEGFGISE